MCLRVAFLTGSWCSNWGSLTPLSGEQPEASAREATQGRCWCEVADDAVVVSKVRPEKASNGVEDKTGLTVCNMSDGVFTAKS